MVRIFNPIHPFLQWYFFEKTYLCCQMKRVIAIALFLSLLLPFYGTYTWLKVQKKQVKRTVKWKMIEGINPQELETLVLSKEAARQELRWIHSREFEYRGEMYDIVETIESKDSIRYICWWDHEETRLNRHLSGLVEKLFQKNPTTRAHQQHVVMFYRMLFFNDIEMPNFRQYPLTINPIVSEILQPTSNRLAPPTPPPKPAFQVIRDSGTGFI
jgi:hypothetical protein